MPLIDFSCLIVLANTYSSITRSNRDSRNLCLVPNFCENVSSVSLKWDTNLGTKVYEFYHDKKKIALNSYFQLGQFFLIRQRHWICQKLVFSTYGVSNLILPLVLLLWCLILMDFLIFNLAFLEWIPLGHSILSV